MVKTTQFIDGMAGATGLSDKTIRVAYRSLREAGLMTTGARGVNAPDMVSMDAARMLIWALVSDRPADGPQVVADFAGLALQPDLLEGSHFDSLRAVFPGFFEPHCFETGIEMLLNLLNAEGGADPVIEDCAIEIRSSDLIGIIEINSVSFVYALSFDHGSQGDLRSANSGFFAKRSEYQRRIKQSRRVEVEEIEEIAAMFAE